MMKLAFAFLCAATAFPAMLFERATPIWPTCAQIEHDMPPLTIWTAYHHYKNIWTETLRADCQWWGKFLAFVITSLAVIAVLT